MLVRKDFLATVVVLLVFVGKDLLSTLATGPVRLLVGSSHGGQGY